MTQNIHRRVVNAAQTQIAQRYGVRGAALDATGAPLGSSTAALLAPARRKEVLFSLLGSPGRVLRLWLGLVFSLWHASCWLLNEFGLRWVLSPRQRQRVRISLIERAVAKGLELQQRVESIEEKAATDASLLALKSA